jgi:hypothetical protein
METSAENIAIRRARRSAITASILALIGGIVTLVSWRPLDVPGLRATQLASMALALLVLAFVRLRRPFPTVTESAVAYLLVALSILAYGWLSDDGRAAQGGFWVPFEPNKLVALALALLAPPVAWAPTVAIAAAIGSALIHFAQMPSPVHSHMAAGEPFTTLVYGALAAGVLAHRLREHHVEQALLRKQSEMRIAQETARIALAISDLANSPLQSLVLTSESLRLGTLTGEEAAVRIGRALTRLQKLSRVLAVEGRKVPLPEDMQSFDAWALLEKQLGVDEHAA